MADSVELRCQRCGVPHATHPDASGGAHTSFFEERGDALCVVCMHKLDHEEWTLGTAQALDSGVSAGANRRLDEYV